MTRTRLGIWLLGAIGAALLVTWIARNTYWEDVKVPMPAKGEARINPFYAAQRFAEALGARTSWDRLLTVPSPDAVIVLSGWHWGIGRGRRAALQQWVESGGRLVVDDTLIDPSSEFQAWSGIIEHFPETEDSFKSASQEPNCRDVREESGFTAAPVAGQDTLVMCDLGLSWLDSDRRAEWALRDKTHLQAMRVRVGRGSVTVISSEPFRHRALFDGDHGRLFVAATALRRGDEVHFLSEDDYPSLLTLTWRHGAPVVTLALILTALLLWRGAVRFGPPAAPLSLARRSLADQIRGSGRFALHHGGGRALHAACVRALDEQARRRIGQYATLPPNERAEALARATGFDRESLLAAIYDPRWRTPGELQRTVALLEAARRETSRRKRKD